MRRHSWERISWIMKIPSRIPQIFTLKKMFDISEKLVSEQEEINNLDKIYWKNHSWKHLSLICDETVINLQRTKVCVFSGSVLCLWEDPSTSGIQRSLEEKGLNGSSMRKATETMTESMESRLNSSGTFSQDSLRCSSAVKSQIY